MARQAERQLEGELGVINALNVFPVPDGDTGTNMLATVREALSQAESASSMEDVVRNLSVGAMLGARGNSGVILSQLFRAQCEVLERRGSEGSLAPNELGLVLSRASELAYRAVANPVQGTMLSVLAAAAAAPQSPGLGDYLGGVVDAAETALAATPDQLPILSEAGVVDSGGYGLLLLLRGWYESLCGQPAPAILRSLLGLERAREQAAHGGGHPADLIDNRERAYGYCVTLLVDAPGANEDELRRRLRELGYSVLVAAMGGRLKLHVHVPDPEPVRALASELGAIAGSDITNIDEQTAVATRPSLPLVAVAAGEGLSRVFRSLGAGVVAGGPGRNPNTAELLSACEDVQEPVFLLPNDGNVIAAARQAAASREGIVVVPTRSLPQGIAATLAYHAEDSAQANAARMQQAAEGVVSAELVGASRAATLHGIHVEAGQTMVLLEGKLLGVEDAGLAALVERIRAAGSELATIYYGAAASQPGAQQLRDRLLAGLPELQVEIVRGDQPHALFIIGFE